MGFRTKFIDLEAVSWNFPMKMFKKKNPIKCCFLLLSIFEVHSFLVLLYAPSSIKLHGSSLIYFFFLNENTMES